MSQEPIVLLVHGAWHGAWCWAKLQAELDGRGVPSLAVDLPGHGTSSLPLGDLYADAHQVAQVVTALGRPVLLVGHSYGGAVITEAANQSTQVTGLVFVAAFALRPGEGVLQMATSLDRKIALNRAIRPGAEGMLVLDPQLAPPALYASCPEPVVAAAVARLGPQPAVTFNQTVHSDALARLPSTYLLCRQDEAIHPDVQRVMAERCSEVVEVDTDHSPFISAVDETADTITRALQR